VQKPDHECLANGVRERKRREGSIKCRITGKGGGKESVQPPDVVRKRKEGGGGRETEKRKFQCERKKTRHKQAVVCAFETVPVLIRDNGKGSRFLHYRGWKK